MNSAKKAITLALTGAGTLAILKTIFGILSGSMVLIASAVDSLLDFIVSIFNLFALKASEKPADKKHNYGHGEIEAIAAVFEGFLIFGLGLYLIISSVKKLIWGTKIEGIEIGIYAMIAALSITGVIVLVLSNTAKKTQSLIVKSDLMHYKMDLLTNIGVLVALALVKFTGLDFLDPLIAIGISGYILYGCWNIFKDGFDHLMDKSIEKDDEIGALILQHPEVESFHKLKSHKSGGRIFISFHMVFCDPNISLRQAHLISHNVERLIKSQFPNASILIKLDPTDDQ